MRTSSSLFPCHPNPEPLDTHSPNYFAYSASFVFIFSKTKFATENLNESCHQTFVSFSNGLQQKGCVRPAAELSDENRFHDGSPQPPIPTSKGHHPRSASRPSTVIKSTNKPISICRNHHHNHRHHANNTTTTTH